MQQQTGTRIKLTEWGLVPALGPPDLQTPRCGHAIGGIQNTTSIRHTLSQKYILCSNKQAPESNSLSGVSFLPSDLPISVCLIDVVFCIPSMACPHLGVWRSGGPRAGTRPHSVSLILVPVCCCIIYISETVYV